MWSSGARRGRAPHTGLTAVLAVLLLFLSGACGGPAAEPAHNDTDVMFLQMGLTQIAEGQRLAGLAETRAGRPEIRAIAAELHGQWTTEAATMRGWLQRWNRPETAEESAGAHAGHGDLHALREEDFRGLSAHRGADFDRAAVALLLGNLHNGMETIRLEATGGSYPGAVDLAERMRAARQGQIQRLLALTAG